MTLSTHATIGAVIGAATGNPLLACTAGFLSHLLVDIIPHGDRTLYNEHKDTSVSSRRAIAFVTIDAAVAIIIVALMLHFSTAALSASIVLGIVGSILPDLLIGLYDVTGARILSGFHRLHFFFHNLISDRLGDIPLRFALIGQAIFILALQRFF